MKLNNRTLILGAAVILFIIINLALSFLTWEQCRYFFPWLKAIPQKTSFKTRHIVQYGTLAIFIYSYLKIFLASRWKLIASTLSSVFIVGSLSEIIQIFIPSRIFSPHDIAFNFIGGVIGLGIYLIAKEISLKNKSYFYNSSTSSSIFKILFILVLFYGWFFDIVKSNFYNDDSIIYLGATGIDVGWDFIKYIFSSPSSFGIQYRPLGFFGYFWFMENVFGDAVIFYRLLSLLLLSFQTYFVIQVVNIVVGRKNLLISSLVILHTALSLYVLYPMFDLSSSAKYVLTGVLFTLGLWVTLANIKEKIRIPALFFICLISLLCHEGSLTFAFVFLLVSWAKENFKINKAQFIITVPFFIYAYLRIFIWEKPVQESFMKIGFDNIPKKIFFLQSYMWNPVFGKMLYPFGGWVLAAFGFALIALVVYFIYKSHIKNKKLIYTLLICQAILLAPFVALQSHADFDVWVKSQYWPGAIATIILASLVGYKKIDLLSNKLLISLLGVFFLSSYFAAVDYQFQLKETYLQLERHVDQIVDQVGHLGDEEKNNLFVITYHYTEKDPNLLTADPYSRYRVWHYLQRTLPAVLSIYFPNHTFYIDSLGRNKYFPTIVTGGSYYYVKSKESRFGYSIHGFKHRIHIEDSLLTKLKHLELHLSREPGLPIHSFTFN